MFIKWLVSVCTKKVSFFKCVVNEKYDKWLKQSATKENNVKKWTKNGNKRKVNNWLAPKECISSVIHKSWALWQVLGGSVFAKNRHKP